MSRKKAVPTELVEGHALFPIRYSEWWVVSGDRKSLLEQLTRESADAVRAGDPILILKVFCDARAYGVVPSDVVLDWLFDRFGAFLEAGGDASLDQTMGMGPGKNSAVKRFQRMYMQDRGRFLLGPLNVLRLLGATIDEAAFLVAARYEKQEWNRTGVHLALGEARLRKLALASSEDFEARRPVVAGWSDERKKEYLKDFPIDQLPDTSGLRNGRPRAERKRKGHRK